MHYLASLARRCAGASGICAVGDVTSRIADDRRGNVMMLMGLSLIPITFATGMVIDYSRAARLQTKLNAAADAAALSATTKPMLDKSILAACNSARRTFLNAIQQSNTGLILDSNASPTVTITEQYESGAIVTLTCPKSDAVVPPSATAPISRLATVSYAGKSTNAFGGVLGSSTIDIGGLGTARSATGTYYQIAFLIDVSNSMGIGGTAAAITGLRAERTIQCSFACHDPNGTMRVSASAYCNNNPMDYFCRTQGPTYCPPGNGNCAMLANSPTYSDRSVLARRYGYKLKIDFVKDALTSFMTRLGPKMEARPDNYSVGVFTFGSEFHEKQSMTNNAAAVQTALSRVDLETAAIYRPGYANQGWTYTSSGLQSLLGRLTNIGDGSTPTSRKTYVIFLSDGVEDDLGNIIYNRGTYYNYASKCEAVKNAGVTMFSIETAYPAITDDTDGQYRRLIGELPGRNNGKQIADVMRDCASSPSRYYWADDGQGIERAVESVFTSIDAETSRLAQ